jgi:hypothetical protein
MLARRQFRLATPCVSLLLVEIGDVVLRGFGINYASGQQ